MNELLKTFQDYQHVILAGALWWGWRELKRNRDEELKAARERDKELDNRIARAVKDSLHNGVGELVRKLLADHAASEQRDIDTALRSALQSYDGRLRTVEEQLRWHGGRA